MDLGVTRGLVVEAYEQLAAEGYVTTVQGSGTRVNDVAAPAPGNGSGSAVPAALPLTHDFRTGVPDLGLFPRARGSGPPARRWRPCPTPSRLPPTRRAAPAAGGGRLPPPRAGVACEPDQVVVCNGFGHGFSLVLRALIDRGVRDVAVEVPGYDDPRDQIAWAGARAVPIRWTARACARPIWRRRPPGPWC